MLITKAMRVCIFVVSFLVKSRKTNQVGFRFLISSDDSQKKNYSIHPGDLKCVPAGLHAFRVCDTDKARSRNATSRQLQSRNAIRTVRGFFSPRVT